MAKKPKRKTKYHYKNENGSHKLKDFVELKHSGLLDSYMRTFQVGTHKCPPKELVPSKQQCFYCMECYHNADELVKEQKTQIKVRNFKFKRDELEDLESFTFTESVKGFDKDKLDTELTNKINSRYSKYKYKLDNKCLEDIKMGKNNLYQLKVDITIYK